MSSRPNRDQLPSPKPAAQDATNQQADFARFQKLLNAGNYDAIVGRGLRRALRTAAADPSLDPEIGFIRLAIFRLLHEEHDPARLAAGIARLSSVAVQASRYRSNTDSGCDEFRSAMLRELEIYEREMETERLNPESPHFSSD